MPNTELDFRCISYMNFYNDLEKYSSNIAVITGQSQQISYEKLLETADNIAKYSKKRSLVFLICKNCFESVAGYIGFLRAGNPVALINNTINDDFLKNLVESYKPEYVCLPTEKSALKINCKKIFSYANYTLLKTNKTVDYTINDNIALLLSTSGSTGSPKMVRQSYKNINNNAETIAQYLEITGDDRAVTTMPMSYTYGLSIINSHLLKGASIILTDATLMEKRFWDTIKINYATTFGGVPSIYEILKKLRFKQMDLPSLKYITQAGGKLSPELSLEFANLCLEKGIKFYIMYGQTEATARMSYLPWEYAHTKAGSMGIAIPGGKFWLEDDDGNIIQDNDRPGELVYRGENVTLGYAESYLDLSKGDENRGVLYTGDIAKRDADGFYYMVGRKKRFLKMFGNRVNLDEVEQLIRTAGYNCACTGTDDNLKIYITKLVDKNQIKKYIAEHIGINKTGFTVVCINKIPHNTSGKIIYLALDKQKEINCNV